MNRITTSVKVDGKGKRKVVAKGGKRQRTALLDPSKSEVANHGAVAGVLGDALGWKATDHIRTTAKPDGTWIFDREEGSHMAALLKSAGMEG